MPAIGNFSGWIQVDGKRLPEYGVEVSLGGTEATCWIPSEAGKAFEICYSDSIRAFSTCTTIFIDGTRSPGKILHPPNGRKHKRSTIIQRGVSTSDFSYKPYVFSNCELIEDDNFITTLSPHVGEIGLSVNYVQVHAYIPRRATGLNLPPLQIHERAKKAIVHGIQLGQEAMRPRNKTRKTKTVRHMATFIFKYRPKAVLMADGTVPSEAPAPRSSPAIHSEVLDLTMLDDEGDTSELGIKVEVKKERSLTYDNEIIDLTI